MEFISFLHGFRRHNHVVIEQFVEFGTNWATKEDLENKEKQKISLAMYLAKI